MTNTKIVVDLLEMVADGIRVARTLHGVEIEDELIGERSRNIVQAIIATYDVVDKEGR